MNIGVNCFPLVENSGGVKQYFLSLFKEFLTNEGEHNYFFFYFQHNLEVLSQLDNLRLKDNGILLKNQKEIAPFFKKIDLYFCPFSSLWPRPVPIPSVLFLHDIQEVFYPQYFSKVDMFNREWHYPGSTRMATHVIVNSHYTKKTIVKHHRIRPEKITVAHLCADESFYHADLVARPLKSHLPDKDFIFYPANHWHHKNHDILLQALKWLKLEKGLSIPAIFTGYDVPNSYPLNQKITEYGLEDQIYSVGYITVEEMAYLYQKARMLIFPSLFEGFGIPIVEAMAAGCPVLASKKTSLPEIGGDAVEYFNPFSPKSIGKAIERIWSDEEKRMSLIKMGSERAREFSSAKLARTHLEVFRKAYNNFSTSKYIWHKWIYQHYHRNLIYFKHKNFLLKKFFKFSRKTLSQ